MAPTAAISPGVRSSKPRGRRALMSLVFSDMTDPWEFGPFLDDWPSGDNRTWVLDGGRGCPAALYFQCRLLGRRLGTAASGGDEYQISGSFAGGRPRSSRR